MRFQRAGECLGRKVERQLTAPRRTHEEPEHHALVAPVEQTKPLGIAGWRPKQFLIFALLVSHIHVLRQGIAAVTSREERADRPGWLS
jgi:hypothetical protein